MKGIALVISEPPNSRRVVFKYTAEQVSKQPVLSEDHRVLLGLCKKFPAIFQDCDQSQLESLFVKQTYEDAND